MISHSTPKSRVVDIINQAQHPIDTDANFDLVISVREGIIHTYAKSTSAPVKNCIECGRYQDLIARREKESFPNVAR